MGLDYTCSVPRRTITSPLSHPLSSSEDMYGQVQKLSKQVTAVTASTTTLEAQHPAAQTTIRALESKMGTLQETLELMEEGLKATPRIHVFRLGIMAYYLPINPGLSRFSVSMVLMKDDDTRIGMLGGGHVRCRFIGSLIEVSPCVRVEKRKHSAELGG